MVSAVQFDTGKQAKRIKTWIFGRDKEETNLLVSLFETANWPSINIQALDTLEEFVNSLTPDLLIICSDVMETFGVQLVRELRKSQKKFPILCIGKKPILRNCLEAIEEGANDFIQAPLSTKELLFRARRTAKAAPIGTENQATNVNKHYKICNLQFNPIRKTLKNNDGKDIKLTNGEVQMLKMLCTLKGSTVSRERLGLLTQTNRISSRSIDVRISKLKKKIKLLDPREDYITSKRNEGYTITENIYALKQAA